MVKAVISRLLGWRQPDTAYAIDTYHSRDPDLVVDTAGRIRAATVRLSQVCRYVSAPMTPVDKFRQKCGVKYANCGAPCRNRGSIDHPVTRPSRGGRALGRLDTESGASSCRVGAHTGVGEV